MKLLPKIVLAVLAPVVLGMLGAAVVLNRRLESERQLALVQAGSQLQQRAETLATRLRQRREALRLLAATPLLRGGDTPAIDAALQAWAGPAGLFDSLAFAPLDADGRAVGEAAALVLAPEERTLLRSGRDDSLLRLQPAGAGEAAAGGARLRQLVAVRGPDGTLAGVLAASVPLAEVLAQPAPVPGGLRWLLFDGQAQRLDGPADDALAQAVRALPGAAAGTPQWVSAGDQRFQLLQAAVMGTDWRLALAEPESRLREPLRGPVLRVTAVLLPVLLLALLGAWWVRRQVARPLLALAEAQARVQAGDLGARAPELGQGELADLARSFNRMVEALQAADRKFRLIFEAFPYPVLISRLDDYRYVDVNPAFELQSGVPRAQAIGRTPVELGLVSDPAAVVAHAQALRAQDRLDDQALTVVGADGRRHRLLVSSRRLQLGGEAVALTVAIDITPIKEAEARLRHSEQAFTALFEMAPLPLAYARQADDFRFSTWNQAWYRDFGYPKDLAHHRAGKDFGLWVDAADRARYGRAVRQRLRVEGFEAQLRLHDGTLRWYELAGQVIDTPDGGLLMTAFVDVTALREAVAAAQASEARLQAVFDASPVAMIVSDAARGFKAVAANAAWYRQFQRTPAQVIGRDGEEMGLWADTVGRARLLGQLQRSGDEVDGFETDLVRGDGSRLRGRVAARRFTAGPEDLMVMVQEDITERVRAAQALSENRELLAHTVDLMPEPMAIVGGDDGRYVDVNRMWVQVLGIPKEQAVGRDSLELGLWEDPSERDNVRSQLQTQGRVVDVPVTYRLPDGRRLRCEVSGAQMMAQGRPIGIWVIRDITAREQAEAALRELNETLEVRVAARTRELSDALEGLRRAQAELVRAEKLASLGALVAGVAHELNTPIGNAVMVASTLADHQREFETGIAGGLRRSALDGYLAGSREALQVLERNLQRAAELVGSFKQLAVDQSSYQRRRFVLAEVVQEVLLALSPTLRRSPVQLQEQVPPALALDSYPGPLGQVLVNLITNALVHAFEPGAHGTITLAAEPLGDDRLRLRLADDGRGIAPSELGRIFDPFYTTRLGQGGSGLGLHIVYNLVTGLLGGRIEVHSQPGAGTEFVIELPLAAPQA
ncbi:PAS domain S-box protein [Aquabacterium sp.]|uniref:PAS domain S-box protein n=1 Tax=Aquabacterium sp. TaxID=1872578 RepID=UPI003784882E